MLNKKLIRIAAVALLFPSILMILSGCWDKDELDSLFIVTAISVDKSESSDLLDITLQIGKTEPSKGGGGEKSDSQDKSSILIKDSGKTVTEGIMKLNKSSSRSLFFQHNQAILLGSSLAEDGIKDKMDMFFRNNQNRMEVPILVAGERADKVLSIKMEQEKSPGIYLSRVMQDLNDISPYYMIRTIDFLSRLREETSAAAVPVVVVVSEGEKETLMIDGMAIFKNGRMIGKISSEETMGFLFAMGDVKLATIVAQSDKGHAVFNTVKMKTKKNVTLRQDGGVKVTLSVNATLGISELNGFKGFIPLELVPYLVDMVQEQIKNQITNTFDKTKALSADIFEIGSTIYRTHPKEWKNMKSDWDKLFSDIELEVEVLVKLPNTGKILQSLEMEEGKS